MVEILIKENQELKQLLINQKFILQPANNYQLNSQNQLIQTSNSNSNQQTISLPFTESAATLLSSSNPINLNQRQPRNLQSQSRSQNSSSHRDQHQQQQVHNQQVNTQQSTNLDASLAENSTNSGILRFINNQYVDDENTLNQQGANPQSSNSRIDFVFMDPAARSRNHFRTNSSGYQDHSNVVDDDEIEDDDDDQHSPLQNLSPPTNSNPTNSNSRLQRSSTRQGVYDADNYDLIIHNDFAKVEDIYNEYYNSLKPQVERVQKAYKIKKIRKYQKIKALAVRVDRYKELKGCSLNESFAFFDSLRIAEDNTKRSIAWLYNSLPDVLKKLGLEDQLKRSGTGA